MDRQEALRLLGYVGAEQPRDESDLKARHQKLVKVWHPDRFAGDVETGEYASAQLAQINAANGVLLAWIRAGRPSLDPRAKSTPPPSGGAPKQAPAPTEGAGSGPDVGRGAPPGGPTQRESAKANAGEAKAAASEAGARAPIGSIRVGRGIALLSLLLIPAIIVDRVEKPKEASDSLEAPVQERASTDHDGNIRLLPDPVEIGIDRRSVCLIGSTRRREYTMESTGWESPPLERGLYELVYRVAAFPPVKWQPFFVEPNKSTRLSAPTWPTGFGGWSFGSSQSAETGIRTDSIRGEGKVAAEHARCDSNASVPFD